MSDFTLPRALEQDLAAVARRYGCTAEELALMRRLALDHPVAARSCFYHLAREAHDPSPPSP